MKRGLETLCVSHFLAGFWAGFHRLSHRGTHRREYKTSKNGHHPGPWAGLGAHSQHSWHTGNNHPYVLNSHLSAHLWEEWQHCTALLPVSPPTVKRVNIPHPDAENRNVDEGNVW